jgi:hypothetical protein
VWLREAPDQSLKTYLYNGDPGDIRKGKPLDTKMLVRVVAVEGTRVRFDRPLRFATRAEWQPELRRFRPTVTESGVEELGFEFPAAQYRGHCKEHGFKAIELRGVADCWVRNVAIHNGDLGINVVACRKTVDGVVFTAAAERASREGPIDVTGHHAIQCKGAEDNCVTRFDLRTSDGHDLSVEQASGTISRWRRRRATCSRLGAGTTCVSIITRTHPTKISSRTSTAAAATACGAVAAGRASGGRARAGRRPGISGRGGRSSRRPRAGGRRA